MRKWWFLCLPLSNQSSTLCTFFKTWLRIRVYVDCAVLTDRRRPRPLGSGGGAQVGTEACLQVIDKSCHPWKVEGNRANQSSFERPKALVCNSVGRGYHGAVGNKRTEQRYQLVTGMIHICVIFAFFSGGTHTFCFAQEIAKFRIISRFISRRYLGSCAIQLEELRRQSREQELALTEVTAQLGPTEAMKFKRG